MHASETDEVLVFLLELSHPSFAEPIRICDDTKALTREGRTWTAFPFCVSMPPEADVGLPVA